MTTTILTGILAALVSGCAVVGDKRVAAGCQLADGITTKQALARGAVEQNPFFQNASGNSILAVKVVIAGLLLWLMPPYEDMSDNQKLIAGALTITGCAAAVNNHGVQR